MTDISQIEERLFLLLDTVEKQAEENNKLQEKIAYIAEKLDSKTDNLDIEIDAKLLATEQKIDVTQKRFDNIVYLSAKHLLEQNFPTLLENVIRENANFSHIEKALDDAVRELHQRVKGNSSLYDVIHKSNLEKIQEMSDALDYQRTSVMKQHFKLLALTTAGIFAIFFLFFSIMYVVTVPSAEHLESLKQEKIQLMRDINQLKNNRTQWIRDAQKNGYLRNQ